MAFGKNVDNLRTNHQGVYIVQDNCFVTVLAFSESTQYLKESLIFLAFPSGFNEFNQTTTFNITHLKNQTYKCSFVGILRGALESFGITSIVTAQVEKLPIVKFQIQVYKNVITFIEVN